MVLIFDLVGVSSWLSGKLVFRGVSPNFFDPVGASLEWWAGDGKCGRGFGCFACRFGCFHS